LLGRKPCNPNRRRILELDAAGHRHAVFPRDNHILRARTEAHRLGLAIDALPS
jgi:hypothetical protein